MERKGSKKLLVWVWGLYITAGYLNALTLLLFGQTAVGQTGRMTNFVYYAFQSEWDMALSLLLLSGSFLLGALIGGFILPNDAFNQQHHSFGWVTIFAGIGLLLFGEIPILNPYMIFYVCMVLGTQNSFAVKYQGFAVSSVVITSVFSNFGVALAHSIKGDRFAIKKALYHGGNILCHIAGASVCSLFYLQNYDWMIIFIATIYILLGIYYLKYRFDF